MSRVELSRGELGWVEEKHDERAAVRIREE
jgi:hypothetical protein